MAQSGFRPVIIIVKMIKSEEMEFREAKKPLAVEIRPAIARAILARPTIGLSKVPSIPPVHEKIGENPEAILWKKLLMSKPGAKKRAAVTSG